MKANELRIGNYVHLICEGHENEPDLVCWNVEDFEFYENRMNDIKSIPLTEEWLLKFGFDKLFSKEKGFKQSVYSMQKPSWQLYELDKGYGVSFWIGNKLEYIHQLQNLYFALTGEELLITF